MTATRKAVLVVVLVQMAAGTVLAQTAETAPPLPDPMDGPMMEGPMGPMFDFAALDADKDGKVTLAELTAARAAEVAGIDADKDGKLSAEELAAAQLKRMQARAAAMGQAMVKRLDSDGDGLLSAAELAARPAVPPFFDRLDADGDGAVTEAEIAAARARMAERMDDRRGGPDGRSGPDDDQGGMRGHGRHGWFFWDK